MHFGSHLRSAFQDWLVNDAPDTWVVEDNYKPTDVTDRELLRRFIECTDVMPAHWCEHVAARVGIVDEDMRGMTYGLAAQALLVALSSTDEAAASYLLAVFGHEDVA